MKRVFALAGIIALGFAVSGQAQSGKLQERPTARPAEPRSG